MIIYNIYMIYRAYLHTYITLFFRPVSIPLTALPLSSTVYCTARASHHHANLPLAVAPEPANSIPRNSRFAINSPNLSPVYLLLSLLILHTSLIPLPLSPLSCLLAPLTSRVTLLPSFRCPIYLPACIRSPFPGAESPEGPSPAPTPVLETSNQPHSGRLEPLSRALCQGRRRKTFTSNLHADQRKQRMRSPDPVPSTTARSC